MRIETVTLAEWEALLPEAGTSPFHAPESLRIIDKHTDGEMQLFAGFTGQEPVALMPVFMSEYANVLRIATSPPPGMKIPYLGPVLMPTSPKPRHREKLNKAFVEGLLERFRMDSPIEVVRLICSPDYVDPRPFGWSGLDIHSYFTYHIDLTHQSLDEVEAGFSRSLRRELRSARNLEITVDEEGVSGAALVHRDLRTRYTEQDRKLPVTEQFVTELVAELGERARTFVVREHDEYLSGIIAIYSPDSVFFWLGGARASIEGVSANTLLHARIIEDAIGRGEASSMRYDLIGANTERLCRYKSKFGGQLVPYYGIESNGIVSNIAKWRYAMQSL